MISSFASAIAISVIMPAGVVSQDSTEVVALIQSHGYIIDSTSQAVGVDKRLVASVIFAERFLNVNWMESELDLLLARSGYNSSMGLGQIKIRTAKWIELQCEDSTSAYYSGASFGRGFRPSSTREELIGRLLDPNWNTWYVAAYLRMICKRWDEAGFPIGDKPDIVASLYSLGTHRPNGAERIPHGSPVQNQFGRVAEQFYLISERVLENGH